MGLLKELAFSKMCFIQAEEEIDIKTLNHRFYHLKQNEALSACVDSTSKGS